MAIPTTSRTKIGSPNITPPTKGVMANASATKTLARDKGVKPRIQTQNTVSVA